MEWPETPGATGGIGHANAWRGRMRATHGGHQRPRAGLRTTAQTHLCDCRVGNGLRPAFAPTFRAKFRDILRGCGATAAFEDVTGLELDRRPAEARVAAFKPDAVLTIASTGGVVEVGGSRLSIDYNTTLSDVGQNRAVWRAKFAFSRGSSAISLAERGAVFAIELSNKLKSDGLLTGCLPIPLDSNGRLDASAIPKPRPDDITPSLAVTRPTISGKPTLKDLQDLLPTN